MRNASFADYHIYSMRDRPRVQAILVPSYEETDPFGAKSVAGICINTDYSRSDTTLSDRVVILFTQGEKTYAL